jgi:hypothetical protein
VAEVPAPASTSTAYILVAALDSAHGGSASFSGFAFRPDR